MPKSEDCIPNEPEIVAKYRALTEAEKEHINLHSKLTLRASNKPPKLRFDHVLLEVYHAVYGLELYNCAVPNRSLYDCILVDCEITESELMNCNITRSVMRKSSLCSNGYIIESQLENTKVTMSTLINCKLNATDGLWDTRIFATTLQDCEATRCSFYDVTFNTKITEDFLKNNEILTAEDVRLDLLQVLQFAKSETPVLLEKLEAGEVDGNIYEGECCCLLGTLANAREVHYKSLEGIVPQISRPAERWFTAIRPGDTPEKSQIVKMTTDWIKAWLAEQEENKG
jgi:hypothetical protein